MSTNFDPANAVKASEVQVKPGTFVGVDSEDMTGTLVRDEAGLLKYANYIGYKTIEELMSDNGVFYGDAKQYFGRPFMVYGMAQRYTDFEDEDELVTVVWEWDEQAFNKAMELEAQFGDASWTEDGRVLF